MIYVLVRFSFISFQFFQSFHSLRPLNSHGGGVSVYISNLYQTKLISECTVVNDNIESCFVNLRRNNKNIVLGVVYRPPSGDYREFINIIEGFIKKNLFYVGISIKIY